MEIRQLETLIHVIEQRSFSKAAEILYITQPTVSAHISSLEEEIGTQLIIRNTRLVYPSQAGHVLYRYAKEIMSLRDKSLIELQQIEKGVDGLLTIGVSSIPSQYYLPELLTAFSKQNFNITYQIHNGDSNQIVQNIAERNLDIGITGIYVQSPLCISDHLTSDEWIIVTPNNSTYRNLSSETLSFSDFCKAPFINRVRGSGSYKDLEHFFKLISVDFNALNTIVEIDDIGSILQLVSHGVGISVMSKHATCEYAQNGKVLCFPFNSVNAIKHIYIVRHKHSPLLPAAQYFYDFATSFY